MRSPDQLERSEQQSKQNRQQPPASSAQSDCSIVQSLVRAYRSLSGLSQHFKTCHIFTDLRPAPLSSSSALGFASAIGFNLVTMAPSRRLVRRQPLSERIKAHLNPWDFLLWLSEELETSDWEQWQRDWGTTIGIGINLVMLIARANSSGRSSDYDDVFSDDYSSSSFLTWLVSGLLCPSLTACSERVHDLGYVYCTSSLSVLLHKRFLYLLSETPLPTVRGID